MQRYGIFCILLKPGTDCLMAPEEAPGRLCAAMLTHDAKPENRLILPYRKHRAMEKEIVKKYSNGEVTVVWKPGSCIHSTVCWKAATGLPSVFNPKLRPWITPEGADSKSIVAQVEKCPSGALSYFYNHDEENSADEEITQDTRIEILPNGPLLVYGNITVKDRSGNETKKSKVTAFCRCGQSQNKPYCDGSHIPSKFAD